jgi:hypothetical protein
MGTIGADSRGSSSIFSKLINYSKNEAKRLGRIQKDGNSPRKITTDLGRS